MKYPMPTVAVVANMMCHGFIVVVNAVYQSILVIRIEVSSLQRAK